jgi:hypothetical protein
MRSTRPARMPAGWRAKEDIFTGTSSKMNVVAAI